MSVSTVGTVLSSLIFRLKNAPGDAEGFLLGYVKRQSVDDITDSQSAGTREEKRTFIQSFIHFSERYSFYDHYGQPDFTKVEALLGDQQDRVVGWFSYRRNSSHRISLRERSVHRRLMLGLSTPSLASQDFLFALVTEQMLDHSIVHSTDYSFYQWIGTSPQPVQLSIANLRASSAVPYHTLPSTQLSPSLQHFSAIMQEHSSEFEESGQMLQAKVIDNLYRAMVAKLQPLQVELVQTAQAVHALGEEVERLQEEANAIQEEEEEVHREVKEGILIDITDGTQGADPANDHAMLVQSTETMELVEPVQTGVLIDFTSGGEEQEEKRNIPQPHSSVDTRHTQAAAVSGAQAQSATPIVEDTETGLVLINPVVDLTDSQRPPPSLGSDSFPQESQELF